MTAEPPASRRPWPRTPGGCAALLFAFILLTALGLVAFVPSEGTHIDVIQVEGRLLDAASMAPLAGARLLTLERPEQAQDPRTVRQLRERGRPWTLTPQEEARIDPTTRPPPPHGHAAGTTDAEGRFVLRLQVTGSETRSMASHLLRPRRVAFEKVRALLVEWGEGARAVLDLTGAPRRVGTEAGEGLDGAIDLGEVRVAAE